MNLLAGGTSMNLLSLSQGMGSSVLASTSTSTPATQGLPLNTELTTAPPAPDTALSAPVASPAQHLLVRTPERARTPSRAEFIPLVASAMMMTGCSPEAKSVGIGVAVAVVGTAILFGRQIRNWFLARKAQQEEPTPAPQATAVRLPIHDLEKRPVQHLFGIGRKVKDGHWRINPEKKAVHDLVSDLQAEVRILPDDSYWLIDNESDFGTTVIRDGKPLKVSSERYLKLESQDVISVMGNKLLRYTGSALLGLETVAPDTFESAPDYPLDPTGMPQQHSAMPRKRPVDPELGSDVMLGYFWSGSSAGPERETQIRRIRETRLQGAIQDLTATIEANNLGEQKKLLEDALAAYQDLDLLIAYELDPKSIHDDRLVDRENFEESIRSRLQQLRTLRSQGVHHYITALLPTDAHQSEPMVAYQDKEEAKQNIIREAAIRAWERMTQQQRAAFWTIEGKRGAELPLAYLRLFFTTWETLADHDDSGQFVMEQSDRVLELLPLLLFISQHDSEAVRTLVHHPRELTAAVQIYGYLDHVVKAQFWAQEGVDLDASPQEGLPEAYLRAYFRIRTRKVDLRTYPVAHPAGLRSDFHAHMAVQVGIAAFDADDDEYANVDDVELLGVDDDDIVSSEPDVAAVDDGEAEPLPLVNEIRPPEPPPLPPSGATQPPPRGRVIRRLFQDKHDQFHNVYYFLPEGNEMRARLLEAMNDLLAAKERVHPDQQSDIGVSEILTLEESHRIGSAMRVVKALTEMPSYQALLASDLALQDWDQAYGDSPLSAPQSGPGSRVVLVTEHAQHFQHFTVDRALYELLENYQPQEDKDQVLSDYILNKWEKIPLLRAGATEINDDFVRSMTELYLTQHPEAHFMIKGQEPRISREERVAQILSVVSPDWDSYDSAAQQREIHGIIEMWARHEMLRDGATEITEAFVRLFVKPPEPSSEEKVAQFLAEVAPDWDEQDAQAQQSLVAQVLDQWAQRQDVSVTEITEDFVRAVIAPPEPESAPEPTREDKVAAILATVSPNWDSLDAPQQQVEVQRIIAMWERHELLRDGAPEITEAFVSLFVKPPLTREAKVEAILADELDDWAARDEAARRRAVEHLINLWERQPLLRGGASDIDPAFVGLMRSSLPS